MSSADSSIGYSLSFLERERDEIRLDLTAFKTAYDILCRRLVESNDADIPRRPILHEWSGSRAVVGSLELAIHAMERSLAEMVELVRMIKDGEIPNTDPPGHPGLGVIDGGRT